MAGEEDDIALSLPQPPPPAAARREAAIGEALRRFDGRDDAPPAARPAPQRAWIPRPQLGLLVAASLVAVIGVPLAWQTATQKTESAPAPASRDMAQRKSFDVVADLAPNAPAAVPKAPAGALEPRQSVAAEAVSNRSEEGAPEAVAPPAPAVALNQPEPPQVLAVAEAKRADAAPVRSGTALAGAFRAPPAAVAAPSPPAAAPPPPLVMQEAPAAGKSRAGVAAADSADSIVVTSVRRRGGAVPDRGDWNACTINDPKRSLAACRHLVDPAAKGVKGQAAAQLADGLSWAWRGDLDHAISAFDRAIAVAPKSALAYLNRGLAYQRQGDADRALADLDQAVRLSPTSARGYYNRSLLLRERGEDRRARADQARAINLDADYEVVVSADRQSE